MASFLPALGVSSPSSSSELCSLPTSSSSTLLTETGEGDRRLEIAPALGDWLKVMGERLSRSCSGELL